MKNPFYGFLCTYFGLIILCFLAHLYFSSEIFISANSSLSFLSASDLGSLTHIDTNIFKDDLPQSYIVFSFIISQSVGIAILSILLWFYWQLFGSKQDKKNGITKAIKLTIIISLSIESLLFLFFLYIIPAEIVDNNIQKKMLTAISLSINSFNNAGFPFLKQLIPNEFYDRNYIFQLGIVGGAVLGNLGIFAIYELFSPLKLRERLNDHTVDWSPITKISVFGTAIFLAVFSAIHFFSRYGGNLSDINIMESTIASIYNVSSLRGFGYYLNENSRVESSVILNLLASMFGSGPFSTGGGLTTLSLIWAFSLPWKNNNNFSQITIVNSIAKNLLIYCLIAFTIPTILLIVLDSDTSTFNLIINQFWLFFNNHLSIASSSSSWAVDIIKSITIMAGRISFVVACFITFQQRKKT